MNRLELRQWRRQRWVTQLGLSELLGVNISTVARWESGESTIPPFLDLALERLNDLYEWTPDGYGALHVRGVA